MKEIEIETNKNEKLMCQSNFDNIKATAHEILRTRNQNKDQSFSQTAVHSQWAFQK